MKQLAFSVQEYQQRLANVQKHLASRRLDALLACNLSSVCYLSGLESIGTLKYWLCLVPAEGEPVLLAQDFESHNASVFSWVDRVLTYAVGADPIDATLNLLKAEGLTKATLGVELGSQSSLSTQDYLRLRVAVPEADLIDATDLVAAVAAIKSPAEIACLRQAARISSCAMEAAIEAVGPGRRDNDIAAAAAERLYREGSEYTCYPPIVTVGRRSGIPHTASKGIPIRPSDAVFMELGACVKRYSSPLMRTAVIGEPPAKMQRMFQMCLASVNAAIASLKPGAVAGQVADTARQAMGPMPRGWVWHGCYAYSVGLGFPPEWCDCGSISVVEASEAILAPGMAFHLTTSIREPGTMGTTCSETVVIGEQDCCVLTDLPRKLFVR